MHVFIDESYKRNGPNITVYVLAALVLYDNESQKAIGRVVRKTRAELEAHLTKGSPNRAGQQTAGRLPELKGGNSRSKKPPVQGLNDYPPLRDAFLRALVAEANFRLYILYFDSREAIKWLPKRDPRWYGRLLQNVVRCAPAIPSRAGVFAVTLDSQDGARAGDAKALAHDRARHRRWIQAIVATVKHERKELGRLKADIRLWEQMCDRRGRRRNDRAERGCETPSGLFERVRERSRKESNRCMEEWEASVRTKLAAALKEAIELTQRNRKPVKVWLVRSHEHMCIQAVDVIANFCKRYSTIDLKRPPYYERNIAPLTRRQREWFSGFEILQERVWWLHNPRLRKPKHGLARRKQEQPPRS